MCTTTLEKGGNMHENFVQNIKLQFFVNNIFVDMYAKHGAMKWMWRVCYQMPYSNVVSWTIMIPTHVKYG
jgi:hypothetical protein